MPRIFVSYRRQDSQLMAGRIQENLKQEFGNDNVFFDRYNIPSGMDFRDYLTKAVNECDYLLVIIGPGWLDVREEDGIRRLDNPNDFVRIEVQTALEADKLVIPVLVQDAKIPKESELPDTIKSLAFRNLALVRPDPDYPNDIDRLIKRIRENPTGMTGVFPSAKRSSFIMQTPVIIGVVLALTIGVIGFFLFSGAFGMADDPSTQTVFVTSTDEVVIANTDEPIFTSTTEATSTNTTEATSTNTTAPTATNTTEPTATNTTAPTATNTTAPTDTNTPAPTATNTTAPTDTVEPTTEPISVTNIGSLAESFVSPFMGHTDAVRDAIFNSDGTQIISSSADNLINIWDATTGELITSLENDATAVSIALSTDENILAASNNSSIRIWNIQTNEIVTDLDHHIERVTSVVFTPSNDFLVASSLDGDISIWSTSNWSRRLIISDAHNSVFDVDVSDDEQSIYSSGFDGQVRVWNINTGALLQERVIPDNIRLYGIDYYESDSEELLAIGIEDAQVVIWNLITDELTMFPRLSDAVLNVDFNAQGSLVASADRFGMVSIWDVGQEEAIFQIDFRSTYGIDATNAVIDSVEFSEDNTSLLVSSRGNTVRLFSLIAP